MAIYNTNNIVIGGTGSIHVAPAGTAVPQTVGPGTSWTGWTELGYTSEKGAQLADSKTLVDIKAWQSFYPVMKIVSERNFDLSFDLQEWTPDTFGLAFGGGSWSTSGGVATWTPPSPGSVDLRSLCVDWVSQGSHWRVVCPLGLVTDAVSSGIARTEASILPIKFSALGQNNAPAWYPMTDSALFAGTSSSTPAAATPATTGSASTTTP